MVLAFGVAGIFDNWHLGVASVSSLKMHWDCFVFGILD